MRMPLLRSCYPSGQVKRAVLVFICQSQLPFISGSNLTARESLSPSLSTEKPADPQSRPLYMLHSHSISAHPNSWIKRHHAFAGCIHHIERLRLQFSLLSNYSSNDGESIMSLLRSACQDVSPEFQFLCTHPNPKQHTCTSFFFFSSLGQCLLHVDTGSQFIYF